MYAVIKAGGRQHRVKPGDVIEVELGRGSEPGQEIEFQPLLVVDDDGKAHVGKEAGKAVVVARLVGEQKGEKVKVVKYRPKTGYARKQGHRQLLTLVEIADVRMGGRRAAASSKKKDDQAKSDSVAADAEAEGMTEDAQEANAEKPTPESAGKSGDASSGADQADAAETDAAEASATDGKTSE